MANERKARPKNKLTAAMVRKIGSGMYADGGGKLGLSRCCLLVMRGSKPADFARLRVMAVI